MNVGAGRTAVLVIVVAAALLFGAAPADADRIRDDQWYLKSLRIAEAHRTSTGRGVTVAVVDSGVYPHPDLRGNLLAGTSVVPGAPGDGRSDPRGHGTEMASLIAGRGRPGGAGVLGIAPDARILPVRALDAEGAGTEDAVAAGIEYAVGHGAEVVNFSGVVAPARTLTAAVAAAERHDVLVVAAVGNTGQDVLAGYPAALDGVLAVGASTRSGAAAGFSFPNANVQICAPGVDITSALPKDRYWVGNGTSESTAIVSGAAALVRAQFPRLSAAEVIHRLTATATDIGAPGRDDACGYGILDVVKALTAEVAAVGGTSTPVTPTASVRPTAVATSDGTAAGPQTGRAGANVPAVVGGVVGVLGFGALIVWLVVRRRRDARGP